VRFSCYQQAVNGNHIAGKFFVGFCTFEGRGTTNDHKERGNEWKKLFKVVIDFGRLFMLILQKMIGVLPR
jgi:hypothetical protein